MTPFVGQPPTPTTSCWWNSSYKLAVLLAAITGGIYLYVIWLTTSNTPSGDGYIQALFTILYWQDGHTLFEKLSNTWWSYFQHRAVFSKIVTLLFYTATGSIDIHLEGLLGNASLAFLVCLFAYSCTQYRLSAYNIPVAALLILATYSWSVATWPECTLFYFSTLMFAYLAFLLLDLRNPHVLGAVLCCWLSAFTMANGLLTIVVGSLVMLSHHFYHQRYTRAQLILWSASAAGCLTVHLITMNVFSTELFGAKTVHDSFINIPQRLLDFIESMGAAPFFPDEYRTGKIALGSTILVIEAILLTSGLSWRYPAIVGLLLFNTGTLFLTSLFRYSAGSNDGYQIFTATNYAALFTLASPHISHYRWHIPALLTLMALAFNINALYNNFPKMIDRQNRLTNELQKFLVTGSPDTRYWLDVILHDAIAAHIYRPLQSHSHLPIAKSVQKTGHCQTGSRSVGNVRTTTGEKSFAVRVDIQTSREIPSSNPQLLLCGDSQHYIITLGRNNTKKNMQNTDITVLLDKRVIATGQYQVQLQTKSSLIALPESISIAQASPWDRTEKDCKIVRPLLHWQAFTPLVNHYCKDVKPLQ